MSFHNHGRRLKQTKGIIVNSFEELDSHAVKSFLGPDTPPVYTVGPLLDLKGQSLKGFNGTQHDEMIMRWLDDQQAGSVGSCALEAWGPLMSLN